MHLIFTLPSLNFQSIFIRNSWFWQCITYKKATWKNTYHWNFLFLFEQTSSLVCLHFKVICLLSLKSLLLGLTDTLQKEHNLYLDISDKAQRATVVICLPVKYPCLLQNISQIDISIQKIWVKCYSLKIVLKWKFWALNANIFSMKLSCLQLLKNLINIISKFLRLYQ